MAFATYMLETDTELWWASTRRLLESSQTVITWEVFKDVFYHKYFPAFVRNGKELEFMKLQRENKSISVYIAKLGKLCKFSTIY